MADEPAGHDRLPEAATPEWFQWLHGANDAEKAAFVASMDQAERVRWRHTWAVWARRAQLPPAGAWQVWLILAGRGFGKTRAGAEWVQAIARQDGEARIALVAASLAEARTVMVEGESGLRRIAPLGQQPRFESSLRRLTWPSGAQAMLFSAAEPDSLRGPQHSHACRPGAAGGFRQPGARPDRRRPQLRDRGGGRCAAVGPRRWHGLAGRARSDRRMGRGGRPHRAAPGRAVAVRAGQRRHAGARPAPPADPPSHRRQLARARGAADAERRDGDRRSGPAGPRGACCSFATVGCLPCLSRGTIPPAAGWSGT